MALIDRIKYDAQSDDIFIWKFPSEELCLGAQLIVNNAQEAIFFKDGKALDTFAPGRYTLTSKNIPLIDKIVNFPFGGQTPFAAEVWFINKTVKRDLKWGTKRPIQVIDPVFNYPISVRAFGSWGVRIEEGASFLNQIVGTQKIGNSAKIEAYFEGEIVQRLSEAVSKFFTDSKISIFNANSHLNTLSEFIEVTLNHSLSRYGVKIENFNVERISIPDEDMQKIQEVLGKKMEVEQLSQAQVGTSYNVIKSFEVLEKAAANEGGAAGNMMAGSLGIGMGVGIGVPMGQQLGQGFMPQTNNCNGVENNDPIEKLAKLKKMLEMDLITQEEFDLKKQDILSRL